MTYARLLTSVTVLLGASLSAAAGELTPVTVSQDLHKIIREAVTEPFFDPWSAQFGQMDAVSNAAGEISVCGMVNATNDRGGYVGFRPFNVYWSPSERIAEVLRAEDVGAKFISELCADIGLSLTVWP